LRRGAHGGRLARGGDGFERLFRPGNFLQANQGVARVEDGPRIGGRFKPRLGVLLEGGAVFLLLVEPVALAQGALRGGRPAG
jgi:hypothetical protein